MEPFVHPQYGPGIRNVDCIAIYIYTYISPRLLEAEASACSRSRTNTYRKSACATAPSVTEESHSPRRHVHANTEMLKRQMRCLDICVIIDIDVYTYIHICTYMYIYTYVYIHTYIYIYGIVYAHLHLCKYVHIYVYIVPPQVPQIKQRPVTSRKATRARGGVLGLGLVTGLRAPF